MTDICYYERCCFIVFGVVWRGVGGWGWFGSFMPGDCVVMPNTGVAEGTQPLALTSWKTPQGAEGCSNCVLLDSVLVSDVC